MTYNAFGGTLNLAQLSLWQFAVTLEIERDSRAERNIIYRTYTFIYIADSLWRTSNKLPILLVLLWIILYVGGWQGCVRLLFYMYLLQMFV